MHSVNDQYNLTISEYPEYLHANVQAERVTRAIAEAYLGEIAEACVAAQCRRLLLERDIPSMLPFGDLTEVTKYFLNLMRGIRIAYVNPYASNDEQMNFAVMFGANRGGLYSLHSNTANAVNWLLRPEPESTRWGKPPQDSSTSQPSSSNRR